MIISHKSTENFFYKALLYTIVGIVGFIIVSILFDINILSFFTLVFFSFLILKGLFHALEIKSCKQNKEHELKVKNDTLYFDKKQFLLTESYLFFRLEECGKNAVVSLYQEKDAKVITIFSQIIFTPTEFEEFLQLIKPYRKFDTFPWKRYNTHKTLYVCKKGVIINGRELFYGEIETIDWATKVIYNMNARIENVTIDIELKNGEKIIETFRNAKDILYAKLLYISLGLEGKDIAPASGYKRLASPFNKILEELKRNECESL